MQQNYTPVQSPERLFEIDAVRGFALLGILMMNIMSFAGPQIEGQLTMETSDIYTGSNAIVILLINILVTSNFYTMFSFLFGLGFYIFLSRAEKRPGSTYLLFVRRMIVLLCFGIAHAVFIWYGDILTVYAITGLMLLFFYRFKPVVNLIVAGVLLLIGTVFVLLLTLLMFSVRDMDMGEIAAPGSGFDMMSVAGGSYMDIVNLNISVLSLMVTSNIVMAPFVLAMFLIGLYVGQKGYFERLSSINGLLWKVALIGILVGLPIKIVTGYAMTYGMDDPMWSIASMLAYTIGGPLMSMGYVALLLLIMKRVRGLKALLQPVGQMALSNYIGQSILMITLFFGFDLFNTIDAVWFPGIVLSTFIIQIAISHLWMKQFRFGPLEWIWRTLTYGRILGIKK
ncbi:DUF418 domain-containing protein [Salinicoccus hispanicus]|uniref:DUF418 domain-containing protein n=1 Tax=Salinicoccus hispanicus TaxID=157225 RepID=A0A6N8TXN2_9STAP|nr:DUF418 domain-containing protein [Salinicoccus hispanicus]MXQ50490.1 DUF418 domain-containing protein [Salinicoccus hispanicus]